MVDPNRKINRLTDKDIEFLEECEEEFPNRFTEEDEEFMEHCAKPLCDPPIIENWNFDGTGHNSRGGSGSRNFGGGRGRFNRNWNRRDGDRNNRGYQNNHGRYNNDRSGRFPDNYKHYVREPSQASPIKNIRRDYGNFVAASKED